MDIYSFSFLVYSSGSERVVHWPLVVCGSQVVHNQNSLLHYILCACILGKLEVIGMGGVKLISDP